MYTSGVMIILRETSLHYFLQSFYFVVILSNWGTVLHKEGFAPSINRPITQHLLQELFIFFVRIQFNLCFHTIKSKKYVLDRLYEQRIFNIGLGLAYLSAYASHPWFETVLVEKLAKMLLDQALDSSLLKPFVHAHLKFLTKVAQGWIQQILVILNMRIT